MNYNVLTPETPSQVPPPRLLLIGPCGAGKTLHGRHLADEIGVFHIQFRERLQEMIAPKMMRIQGQGHRKVGAEYTEDDELPLVQLQYCHFIISVIFYISVSDWIQLFLLYNFTIILYINCKLCKKNNHTLAC